MYILKFICQKFITNQKTTKKCWSFMSIKDMVAEEVEVMVVVAEVMAVELNPMEF